MMKANFKVSLAVVVIVTIFCFGQAAAVYCAEPAKIKGFYIGMSIDDALKNFERLGFKGLEIKERKYGGEDTFYEISPSRGDTFRVETDYNSKEVTGIQFSSEITDKLFNTRGINAEIFRDQFAQAYGVQMETPYKDNPGSEMVNGWEWTSLQNGYRVRISIDKAIEIIRTPKKSEFKFD